MENQNDTAVKKRRIVPKGRVKMIVQREFVGGKNAIDVMLPIVTDDIKAKIESHTFDLSA